VGLCGVIAKMRSLGRIDCANETVEAARQLHIKTADIST
jgi:hypothetical protein